MTEHTHSKLRAWWSHRQALDGRLSGQTAPRVLAETGWARSLGGVAPYLSLFSRAAISRETADAAVRALDIHELPAARRCTYVVPASDFGLALKLGQAVTGEEQTASKLGVTPKEIAKLCDAVLSKLSSGPLEPSELRDVLGSVVRNLGEQGKRKGLTTTLPVALGKLQSAGEIRRVPLNGRLDQQRYRYQLWRPNPLSNFNLSIEQCQVELARRFFSWIAPATLAEFQSFSGLGVKAGKAAVEPLQLEPLPDLKDRLLLPEQRDAWESFRIPKEPQYALVSSLDAIAERRRNVTDLVDSADLARKVPLEKGTAALGSLSDLPSHAILDRGRLIGLWEYDITAQSIVWILFIKPDAALRNAVKRTEQFVRDQLGDARSVSLDTPKSRESKIAALRAGA
ncbi:MAG: winged helix DNA-binding domain-containing protein [Acidobacteriaceae bacterium]|nr:winged helix DNA-binding domain-containing protein [Acidobacteriaceae bacterium]